VLSASHFGSANLSPLIRIIVVFCLSTSKLAFATVQQVTPWIGVAIDNGKGGVLVKEVLKEGPAAKADLRSGDIITAIDGQTVTESKEFIQIVRGKIVGASVKLQVIRDNKPPMAVQLQLEAKPDQVALLKSRIVGKPMADFQLASVTAGNSTGPSLGPKSWKDKVVILQFWATWCPACRSTHAALETIAKEIKGLEVILVSDEPAPLVADYLKKHSLGLTNVVDTESKLASELAITALPTMVLIDKSGVVKDVAVGAGIYLQQIVRGAASELGVKL
jgi:thiol-disulfide isomerase/thioredoxin